MKHLYIGFFCFLMTFCLQAQRGLFNQHYEQMALDFKIDQNELDNYKSQGKVIVFNEEKHKTKLAKKLLRTRKGKTKTLDKGYYEIEYKVIGKEKIPHYRIRYIFIDKNKFDDEETFKTYLNKVRNLLDKTAFKTVAMQYSMDYNKNVGGDSGWFKEGQTHPVFFKEVTNTNRLSEEVFEFEIPESSAYYFAKKNYSKKDIKEILVLQTKKRK